MRFRPLAWSLAFSLLLAAFGPTVLSAKDKTDEQSMYSFILHADSPWLPLTDRECADNADNKRLRNSY